MKEFFTFKRVFVVSVLVVLALSSLFVWNSSKNKTPDWITDTVTRGEVAQIVSVSGTVEAKNTAELAFPTSGIVDEVLVSEGDVVVEGQTLATLEQDSLQAERRDAVAALLIAKANYDELVSGPRDEVRDVTTIDVAIARDNLMRTKAEEAERVTNAYRTLLSDDLEAFPTQSDNSDVPPTISGTYTCAQEGVYTLSIFSSGSQSGHSYRLSGLESGTFPAYTESPAPMGTCGLMVQFDDTENYASKDWVVAIPNTRSSSYTTNLNAYQLAKQQATNTIGAAEQAYEKAISEQVLENAAPREEALARAQATVLQAEARLAEVDARIGLRVLRAPFSGSVDSVDIIPGETVSTVPVITIVAENHFELKVRIPEIDITKIAVGQQAEVVFDARRSETVPALISFISPLATLIDGVAYFEATLTFETPPPWLRGGLNADANILVERRTEVLRIPKRFLIEGSVSPSVLVPRGTVAESTPVEVGFIGNDGYVEVMNLEEGTTIVAP